MMKIRIYGKELNRWTTTTERNGKEITIITQVELEYKEYDVETGILVGVGSEDFSRERYNSLVKPGIYTWDGKKVNKGGKKWWDYRGWTVINKSDKKLAKQYIANKYNAEVQFRA